MASQSQSFCSLHQDGRWNDKLCQSGKLVLPIAIPCGLAEITRDPLLDVLIPFDLQYGNQSSMYGVSIQLMV
ncbi:hypothetical protein AB3S75_040879 [Citrus x aurantiifolia]